MWWKILLKMLVVLIEWLLDKYAKKEKISERDREYLEEALGLMQVATKTSQLKFGIGPRQIEI